MLKVLNKIAKNPVRLQLVQELENLAYYEVVGF